MARRLAIATYVLLACVALSGPSPDADAAPAASGSGAATSADAKAWLAQAQAILAKTGTDRDVPAAVTLLEQAAAAGNTSAMRTLAGLLWKGDGVAADPDRAEALLQQAIAAGDTKWGNENLGDFYRYGSPPRDPAKAVAAYQAAADAGEAGAMRKLAALYLAGDGVAADPAHAETLLRQAAAAGDSNGWNGLGDLYRAATPLADPAKAADAYQHAADAHNATGARKLMTMLANGDGIAADPARAENLAEGIVAAGDAKNGYDMLGDFYRLYTPLKSASKAADAYQKAADAGNTSSMRKLAAMLWRADGVPMDADRALALISADIAAGDGKNGNDLAGDLYRLPGPRQNLAKATAAYQAAADAGNAGAMRKLATMLITRAPGVKTDPQKAEALLQQSAAADPRNGLMALGDFYLARTPLSSPAKAIDAYQKATAAGNAGAVLKLASAHLNGRLGAASSPAKGVDLLKSAIADKVPNAAVTLANAYIWGTGVGRQPAAGVKILNAAADAGDVAAARRLVALYSAGTTKGISRNLTRASAWLKSVESQLTPDVKALEELALKAASATSAAARKSIMAQYLGFEGEARATAATRIYQVNPGA
jgi:TPR repeat protein